MISATVSYVPGLPYSYLGERVMGVGKANFPALRGDIKLAILVFVVNSTITVGVRCSI